MLVGFFLASRFVLFSNPKVSIYLIIVSVFFADWLHGLDLIPEAFTWLPDVALIILTGKVLVGKLRDKEIVRTKVEVPLLLFLVWATLSMVANGQSFVGMLVSSRQLLKFALMFFLVVNLRFEESFFKRIVSILVVLFIVQVPVALIKMAIYGQGEYAIGTYAYFGGGLSAVLPLLVMSVALGFYLFERPRVHYLLFVVFFQLFYYACPKRAYLLFVVLLVPFLAWQAGLGRLKKFLPLTPLFGIGLVALFLFNPTLNTVFDNPHGAIDWASSYTYQHQVSSDDDEVVTSGRVAVAELAYGILKENFVQLWLGFGPGTMTESFDAVEGHLRQKLPIYYGLTEFVTMSLEYGLGGVLLFLWMLFRLFRVNQRFFRTTADGYWKALSFGFKGIWFSCLMAFFYGPVFRLDVTGFLFWFLAAAIHSVSLQNRKVESGAGLTYEG